jgi:biopolymer transport protein ExbD
MRLRGRRDGRERSEYESKCARIEKRLTQHLKKAWENVEAKRLVKRLRRHRAELFVFLYKDGVPSDNNHAERVITPHSCLHTSMVQYDVMPRHRPPLGTPRINMTPMIDVVFLLLAFFVLTFRIVLPEGDFNIKMLPQGEQRAANVPIDPVHVRLTADADGLLLAIQLNGDDIDNFDLLRLRVLAISRTNPDPEIILFFDKHLRYEYLIKAVTAVGGEIREGQVHKITENIKFAPQESSLPEPGRAVGDAPTQPPTVVRCSLSVRFDDA